MSPVYTVVISKKQFAELDQQEAFYSASPEKHEQARNIPADCKTHLVATEPATARTQLVQVKAIICALDEATIAPEIIDQQRTEQGIGPSSRAGRFYSHQHQLARPAPPARGHPVKEGRHAVRPNA